MIFIKDQTIGMMVRVFDNDLEDRASIPVRVRPKTQKWYLIPPCLTQHYKVRIKGKVEGKERRPFLYLGVVAIEKEPSGCPRLHSRTLLIIKEVRAWPNCYQPGKSKQVQNSARLDIAYFPQSAVGVSIGDTLSQQVRLLITSRRYIILWQSVACHQEKS